jgi:hypothetical protein
MPYVDKEFYDNTYLGEPIEDEKAFNRYAQRASEVIDMITGDKLKRDPSLLLNDYIANQVKLATSAQTEYFALKGGYFTSMSGEGEPHSVSIGSFNYTNDPDINHSASKDDLSQFVCSSVYGYLNGTGLLYRGVNICGH